MSRKTICFAALALVVGVLAAGSPAAGQQTAQTAIKPPVSGTKVPPPAILKPDFKINRIWFAKWVENPNVSPLVPIKTDLKLGEKVWMVCDLVNASPADSKGLWTLGFYIDSTMMWNNSWGDLGAGKPLQGLGPYTPGAAGSFAFRCVCDINKQITELHEDNNVQEILFKVVK
jgi:hypothetical protein